MTKPELDERELPDSYPIYPGYLYVINGSVVRATRKATVADWKAQRDIKSVMSCDIKGRNLWNQLNTAGCVSWVE